MLTTEWQKLHASDYESPPINNYAKCKLTNISVPCLYNLQRQTGFLKTGLRRNSQTLDLSTVQQGQCSAGLGVISSTSYSRPHRTPHLTGSDPHQWTQWPLLLLQMLLYVHRETIRTIRDRELGPCSPPWLSHSCWALTCIVQCCFTSTETLRTIRDGEPRTSTSTFTPAPELWQSFTFKFSVALRPQRS